MNSLKSRPLAALFKLLIIPIFAVGALFGAAPTFADDGSSDADAIANPAVWIQLSPPTNRITITPGTTSDYTMTVENIGAEDFDYRVYATPFSAANEDYEYDFSTDTSHTQISNWITIADSTGAFKSEVTFHLNKGEKQEITYRVTFPETVSAGGQYATVFAESVNTASGDSPAGVTTVSRVGQVIYANTTDDVIREGNISDTKMTTFLMSGNISSSAKVANTGNTEFASSYKFTVKTLFGETVYEDTQSSYIFPDSERKFSLTWENTPVMGIFQASIHVTAADQTIDQSEVIVVLPIFVIIILLLLLTTIIIWIIILIRKRKERKTRVLS